MTCQIHWNTLAPDEWESRFARLPKSNLLQSQEYGQAMSSLQHQKVRRGLITIDGREAGMVQILETGILFNLFHAVMLDRGPLWFEGFGGAAQIKMFFDLFNGEFPARFGRRRRVLPEVEFGPAAGQLLKQTGLQKMEDREGYQTVWIDLEKPLEALRDEMEGRCRNQLNKAERAGVQIEWDFEGRYLPWLLKAYSLDKTRKGYSGPSPKVLQNIVTFSLPKGGTIIGRALLEDRCVASILLLKHGRSATYQVGWSHEDGRKVAANHLLLWQAMNVLKRIGVHEFDLGGINDEEAKGVKTFKEGFGGRTVRYAGHYY